MKPALTFLISFWLLVLPGFALKAQNIRNFHYIIHKEHLESGRLKIVYRDPQGQVRPLSMCYPKLRAEGLDLEEGVAVFHFERIPSSQYDTIPACISNKTPLGRFEIDVNKRTIGDSFPVAKIPFHAINWYAALSLYKIRFAEQGTPVTAFSDPASMIVSVIYGYTLGYSKISHRSITHYYTTLGPFLGITSASLTTKTVTSPSLLTKDQSNVAFSYGISSVLGRNNFGVSFSLGFDASVGKNSSLWIYQHKPWLGIGVSSGLAMF